MRVISKSHDLCCVDILIEPALKVVVDGDGAGEVELRVQRASAMARLHRGGGGELVDVAGAGGRPVKARLDAVASGIYLGKSEV